MTDKENTSKIGQVTLKPPPPAKAAGATAEASQAATYAPTQATETIMTDSLQLAAAPWNVNRSIRRECIWRTSDASRTECPYNS